MDLILNSGVSIYLFFLLNSRRALLRISWCLSGFCTIILRFFFVVIL